MKVETIFNHKISEDVRSKVIIFKNEAYSYFDSGLSRHVFVNKDKTKVIKILISDTDGHNFNLDEYEIYNSASENNKKQMAYTEISSDNTIIVQEYCSPIKFDERQMTLPQIRFALSCRNEVGWTNDGKLVCFDLDEFKRH